MTPNEYLPEVHFSVETNSPTGYIAGPPSSQIPSCLAERVISLLPCPSVRRKSYTDPCNTEINRNGKRRIRKGRFNNRNGKPHSLEAFPGSQCEWHYAACGMPVRVADWKYQSVTL